MSKKNPKPAPAAPALHLAANRKLVYWADENGESAERGMRSAGDSFPAVAFFCDASDAAEYVALKGRIEGTIMEIAEWRKTLALACMRQPDDPHARARSQIAKMLDAIEKKLKG